MEKKPQFIKEFSKKHSPEERDETARKIKARRKEHFDEIKATEEKHAELQRASSEREQTRADQREALESLTTELERLSSSKLGEIVNFLKIKKLRADLVRGEQSYEELTRAHTQETAREQHIASQDAPQKTSHAFQEARAMLNDFYTTQEKKWSTREYTREEITKYFSEEHLASLSLNDYILLLKRFPRDMVAHVTRQGIRDHTGHLFHGAGLDAYADGFIKILEDGRLRSPLGVYLVEHEKEHAIEDFVRKYMLLDQCASKEAARALLDRFLDPDTAEGGRYADRMAIHFAANEVANTYYGSEKGNEIFIAYPSLYIASQYYFNGNLTEEGGGYWNDQWVWANEERGMDLNAGLIFIPRDARVSAETGSRYEIDEHGNPRINAEYIEKINAVMSSSDFTQLSQELLEITGKFSDDWLNLSEYTPREQYHLRDALQPYREKLEREFGITDIRLQRTILDYNFLLQEALYEPMEGTAKEERLDFKSRADHIKNALRKRGILFEEARDPIPSQEFWEKYFDAHPNQRTSKIVYYQGQDPTEALHAWRKENGVGKRNAKPDLGFPEKSIKRTDEQAVAGRDRFRSLAIKVIEDYFEAQEAGGH